MLNTLPKEIVTIIFEYDPTFKELYDKVINNINKFPKFIEFYEDENSKYFHFLNNRYKGIFMFSVIQEINYKRAFKKFLQKDNCYLN